MQVAVKAGGDEVLHTVMEIRQNPYEDLDEGEGPAHHDRTVDIGDSGFDDVQLGGALSKKPAMPLIPPLGGGASGLAISNSSGKLDLAHQGNMKMNLGLHNKNVGNARSKKNI